MKHSYGTFKYKAENQRGGKRHFPSEFNSRVYQVVRRIPKGKVMTYKDVARKIGNIRAVRAVGNALRVNPYAPVVPCHRVIRSDRRIGGFAGGTKKKSLLLRKEGVSIVRNKVDLERFGYR